MLWSKEKKEEVIVSKSDDIGNENGYITSNEDFSAGMSTDEHELKNVLH